ncbi:MAG: AMP-binding protein, partial [Pirellulales bacterium]
MSPAKVLCQLLDDQAALRPQHVAVEDPASGGAISYAELTRASDRLRDRLIHWGVRRGDRVGIYLTKSIDAVATIFGILKTGAAYVPVDPHAPASRNAYVFGNCAVKA